MSARGESISWLSSVIPLHQRLTRIAVALMEQRLQELRIDFLSVAGRTKTLEGCKEKIKRKEYSDPKLQLTDISGIRIITYFESQAASVADVVRQFFNVDSANSSDMRDALGDDRIGYRSSHFVCQLGSHRAPLPEYVGLADLKFEIQVRTVLQHAWAELAHDRTYKFSGALPPNIQRQLNLYSGTLEIIDRGFDEISQQIDSYKEKVARNSEIELESSPLDSITIKKFISTLDNLKIRPSSRPLGDKVVEELSNFGIESIADLKRLITKKFVRAHNKYKGFQTELGLLRSVMMYSDLPKYLEHSWSDDAWQRCIPSTFNMLESKYGLEVSKLFKRYGIELKEEDD